MIGSVALARFTGFSDDFLSFIHQKYGSRAEHTMEKWAELVKTSRALPERKKLEVVNRFFNRNIWFVSDIKHWGKQDYWATPMETMATLGGDCEDFTIAKYFTLRELDVPDERLRLTYVRATRINAPHMVLAYYPTQSSEPLILDNLIDDIEPASERRDLIPVYSFNGRNLWQARQFDEGRQVGSAANVNLWTNVIQRMRRENFPY
ncbi:MAG: transglutaminase-like cysteine peptidase [Arenicellales bacterium]